MREGWVSHRFDEVFDLQMGKTPARDNPSYWGDDNIWVSIADMKDVKYISSSKEQITDIAVRESGIKPVKKGTAIMSFKLSIGKAAIASTELYTNEAIMSFSVKDGHRVKPEFIYYFLKGFKWAGANKAVMGFTLNKKTIASNIFSYPPIAEQERIVAELDCLTGIIEKKKQQLEELDKLAQSIFYDMFGDPITNEKGWKVKRLGDLCEVITKGTTPSSLGFSFVEKGINFLKVESFNSDETLNEAKIFHITKECDAALQRSRLEANDILMCIAGATCGRLAIVPSSVIPANTNQAFGIIRLKDKEQSFHRYIYSFLHSSFIRDSVNELMKGVAQPNLTLAHLRGFCILLPPPALQNEFAQKIETIVKQKELLKQSIRETETLFSSRMDYWFN